jgi:hypothetical protein
MKPVLRPSVHDGSAYRRPRAEDAKLTENSTRRIVTGKTGLAHAGSGFSLVSPFQIACCFFEIR